MKVEGSKDNGRVQTFHDNSSEDIVGIKNDRSSLDWNLRNYQLSSTYLISLVPTSYQLQCY